MAEWFTDEALWEDLYPFLFPETRIAAAEQEVESVLRLTQFAGSTVLDLCCGPGRHALALAKRGLRVTGVDRTALFLEEAQARAAALALEVEWVQEDMRRFARRAAFDLALSLFTSFGYFDQPDEDLAVLENLHQSLKPGGILVLDMVGKECLARSFQPISVQDLEDGSLLIERREVRDDWTRLHNQWTLVKEGSTVTYEFDLRLYSGLELKERLGRVGFAAVKLFSDFAGSVYGPEAQRLVAVASKAPDGA